jgi:hypothetical protein
MVPSGMLFIASQLAKVCRGGHGSGSPSVLRQHRPGQSHVSHRPTDAPRYHESPQGFIEGQRPCLAILGLLQADKPVGCINTVPSEPEQLPFPHTRMNSRENNRLEPGLTGLDDSLCFSLDFSLPPGRLRGALQWE